MQKEILAVRHLSLKLNDRLLLKDFCLSVFEGETLALCGIRDAGKSVLARTLVGEFPDYQGKIILN
jgi:ABC-type multidrug transport system ATPase subunit